MRPSRVRQVVFNNRKKQMTVHFSAGHVVSFHYGQAGIRKNISDAFTDPDTSHRTIVIEYQDGTKDCMPYDQPLAISRDPEFLLQQHLEVLTARIRQELTQKGISLCYLAERIGTSDNQIQRLLNPSIRNKNLSQLHKMASLLGLELEFCLKSAA